MSALSQESPKLPAERMGILSFRPFSALTEREKRRGKGERERITYTWRKMVRWILETCSYRHIHYNHLMFGRVFESRSHMHHFHFIHVKPFDYMINVF